MQICVPVNRSAYFCIPAYISVYQHTDLYTSKNIGVLVHRLVFDYADLSTGILIFVVENPVLECYTNVSTCGAVGTVIQLY